MKFYIVINTIAVGILSINTFFNKGILNQIIESTVIPGKTFSDQITFPYSMTNIV